MHGPLTALYRNIIRPFGFGVLMKRVLPVALLFTGCLLSGKSDRYLEPVETLFPGTPYSRFAVLAESTSGARSFVSLRNMFKSAYCVGDSLVDNGLATTIQEYRLSGNGLDFWFSSPDADSDTSVQLLDRYARITSGTGLRGEWKRTGSLQRKATAPLSEAMRKELQMRDSAYLTERMVITSDSLYLYYDRTANSFIWDILLNHSTGMRYEFHGKDTVVFLNPEGWRVTLSEDESANVRAVSSRPQDVEYIRIATPTHCPDGSERPDWYTGFFGMEPDPQPVAKRAARGAYRVHHSER
jgi:hypothetical protein